MSRGVQKRYLTEGKQKGCAPKSQGIPPCPPPPPPPRPKNNEWTSKIEWNNARTDEPANGDVCFVQFSDKKIGIMKQYCGEWVYFNSNFARDTRKVVKWAFLDLDLLEEILSS